MSWSERCRFYQWIAPLAIIGLIVGLFVATPMPSTAQGPDCGKDHVVGTWEVGDFTADEMAANEYLHNDLPSAIDAAFNRLKVCNDSWNDAYVHILKDAKNLRFPDEIGDGSYGAINVVGKPGSPTIIIPDGQKIVNETPLVLDSLKLEIVSEFMSPRETLVVINSTLTGRGSHSTLIRGQTPSPHFNTILLKGNKFSGVTVNIENLRLAEFSAEDNVFSDQRDNPRPFIWLTPNHRSHTSAVISGNKFEYGGRNRNGRMVVVQRRDVLISRNTFSTQRKDEGEGIYLDPIDTTGADPNLKMQFIDIRMNTFNLRRSISNAMPDGPPKDQLGEIIFHYNDLSFSPETLPKNDTYMDHTQTYGPCNYWGDLAKRDQVKANRASMNRYLTAKPTEFGKGCKDDTPTQPPTPPSPPAPNPNPSPTPTQNPSPSPTPTKDPSPGPDSDDDDGGDRHKDRYGDDDRYTTSTNISGDQYPDGAEGVIIARAGDAADSVSAVPFAKLMKMPILLTDSDRLHPAVAKEVKRLLPKGGTVYIMGREVAIHPSVEAELKAIAGKTERIAGENRAATAVESAKRLKAMDKLHHIVLADGSDWQPDLIAGPAAAISEGATLLTWGETMAPETAAYMLNHANLPVTAVGEKAAKTGLAKRNLTATDPTELSLQVIDEFFKNPKVVGFATSDDFADALTGGAHMAGLRGPLILIGHKTPDKVTKWVKDTKSLRGLIIYGGTARISADQEADLRTALKH